MIEAAPGQLYTATVEDAPAGLVGTIGYHVEDASNNDVDPRTTAGIAELVPGVYAIERTAPSTGGDYIAIWDTGDVPLGPEDVATEVLRVAYIPPVTAPQPGVAPFLQSGQIQDREGNVLADVACSTWQLSSSAETGGEAYDWGGVADITAADELVGKRNRILVVGTESFRVVSAIRHDALPHTELALRVVKVNG